MKYHIETTKRFKKEMSKLDKYTQSMIKTWIANNIQDCSDPRAHGKSLTGNRNGQWRYRIGDYRIICKILDDKLVILALSVGHRKKVYRD